MLVVGAVGATLAGAALFVPSLVADSEVSSAALHWRDDPPAALERLDLARSLNPLAARPWLVEAKIEADRRRFAQARIAFERAAEREPDAWYPQFAAGLTASAAGDVAGARARLRAALARNPRDPLIPEALRRLQGSPMTFAEAVDRIDERLDLRRNKEP
jgi:Flp pilus assembly protein TadD